MNKTLYNFEHHVPFKIWQRGMDYYDDHAVIDLEETSPDEWEATVQGTEDYYVEISLNGDNVESWYCDCPYDGGDICKHVVAVVLAIRNVRNKGKKTAFPKMKANAEDAVVVQEKKSELNLDELLKLAKTDDFRDFLLIQLSVDKELNEAFIGFLKSKYMLPSDRDYKQEVEDIFKKAYVKGRSGYRYRYTELYEIDWKKVDEKMLRLLKDVSVTFDKGNPLPALEVCIRYFQLLDKYADDSIYSEYDTYVYYSCEEAEELLLDAAGHSSLTEDKKRKLLGEVRSLKEASSLSNYGLCDVDDLMMQLNLLLQTPEDALKMLDALIAEHESSYDQFQYVIQKMELLQGMGKENEAWALAYKYIHLPQVRMRVVENLKSEKRYVEALQMLDDGIRLQEKQKEDYRIIDEWLLEKLSIYEVLNDTDAVIATSRMLFIHQYGSMEYYHKLKLLVPSSRWKPFLFEMIGEVKWPSWSGCILPDIYMEEDEHEKLYHWISTLADCKMNEILKYGLHLPESYHASLLELFAKDIRAYAEKKIGRNYYVEVAEKLHRVKKLKGGSDAVRMLVAEFKKKYSRRPAMMDELRGL